MFPHVDKKDPESCKQETAKQLKQRINLIEVQAIGSCEIFPWNIQIVKDALKENEFSEVHHGVWRQPCATFEIELKEVPEFGHCEATVQPIQEHIREALESYAGKQVLIQINGDGLQLQTCGILTTHPERGLPYVVSHKLGHLAFKLERVTKTYQNLITLKA
jgi:hypothetical protein